jgi:hypothetical protein
MAQTKLLKTTSGAVSQHDETADSARVVSLGLGLDAVSGVGIAQKDHGAFGGSELNVTTGAVQTTDATPTQLKTVTLADNSVYWFEAHVIGRDTAGTERAFYIRQARAHRQAAGAATLGTIQAPVTDETNAGLDATFTASGNDVRVTVTGLAATTINWTCALRYQRVSGNT